MLSAYLLGQNLYTPNNFNTLTASSNILWNAQFFAGANVEPYFSPKPLYPDQSKYINYFGGYLIEVKVDKEMAKKIDRLFKKTTSLSEISQLELITMFQEKAPCTVTVSKNRKKGEVFKRKIKRFF